MRIEKNFTYPFHITAGNGNGIAYSSQSFLKQLIPAHAYGRGNVEVFVKTNGNLCVFDRHIILANLETTLALGWVYNSQSPSPWIFSPTPRLTLPKSGDLTLSLTETDGRTTAYIYDAITQTYYAPGENTSDGIARISLNSTIQNWELYHPKTRHKQVFNANGQVMFSYDATGNCTEYQYDDNNQLAAIKTAGTTLLIERKLKSICIYRQDKNLTPNLLHTYDLDAQNRLIKSSPSTGNAVNYEYADDTGKLLRIHQDDTSEMGFTYNPNSQIKQIQVGNKKSTTVHQFEYSATQFKFQDASGVRYLLDVSESQQLQCVQEEKGFLSCDDATIQKTNVEYYSNGQIKTIKYPDASEEKFYYAEQSGLLTKFIKRDQQVEDYTYCNELLTEKTISHPNTDKKLQTRFVYDTSFNEKFSVLRFIISPCGRVTELIRDKYDLIAAQRQFSQDLYPADITATCKNLNDWIKQIGYANTQLTSYIRDENGRIKRRQAFTAINADGSGCPNESMSDTAFTFNNLDQAIEETQLVSAIMSGTIYHEKLENHTIREFDGNGDLRLEQNAANAGIDRQQVTHIDFEANTVLIVHPNELKSQTILNSKNTEIQGVEFDSHTTEKTNYIVDANNEITKIIDANKTTSFYGYDKQHQLSYKISQTGLVEENIQHTDLNYEVSTHYATAVDIAHLYTNDHIDYARLRKALATKNFMRREYQFFDSEKRPRYFVNALNKLTEFQYDAFGNQVAKINYKNAIQADELNLLLLGGKKLERTPSRLVDIIHSTFYDADGLKIAEQDPDGYITAIEYDGAKNRRNTLLYAKPDLNFTTDFSQLILQADASKDCKSSFQYDAKGQCRFEVNAEGFVIEHRYHANGKKQCSIFYATPAIPPTVITAANDHKIEYFYDEFSRLIRTEGPFDKVTWYTYDNMNKLTSSYIGSKDGLKDSDHYRGNEKIYDAFGRIIAEANPFIAEKLTGIDQDQILTPEEKTAAKAKLWESESVRSEYVADLKVNETDSNGNKTSFIYDADKRLKFTIDANGSIKEFTRNGYHEIIEERQYVNFLDSTSLASLQGGLATTAVLTKLHNLKDADNDAIVRFEYNQQGKISKKIDAEGSVFKYEYDEFGRLSREQIPALHGQEPLSITHDYDMRGNEILQKKIHAKTNINIELAKEYNHPLGKLTTTIDGLNHVTRFEYDRLGNCNKIKRIRDDGSEICVSEKKHDAFNRVLSETDAIGATTTHEYNDAKNLEIIRHPDNTETKIQKNIFDEVIALTNALGETDNYTHAPDGKIRNHIDDLKQTTFADYDAMGNLILERNAQKTETTYQYKNNQLKTKINDAKNLKATESYEHDAFGNIIKTTNAKQIVTINRFDKNQRKIVTILDPKQNDNNKHLNSKTTFQYTPAGKQTEAVQGDINCHFKTRNHYDGLNRLTQEITDPDCLNLCKTHVYDNANNILREIDARGYATINFYNDLGQKTFTFEQTSAKDGRLTGWQYDAADNIIEARIYSQYLSLEQINQSNHNDLKLIPQSRNDNTVSFRYDSMKRERFQLKHIYDARTDIYQLLITEIRYDKVGRQTHQIQYATPVSAESYLKYSTHEFENIVAAIATHQDRIERKIYDKAGRERYLIDADGYLTEHQYDKNGDIVTIKKYKTLFSDTNAILNATDADLLAKLFPILSDRKNVARKHYIYDSLRRCTHKIKPNGLIVRKIYDLANKPTEIIHFDKPVANIYNHAECIQDALSRITSAEDKVYKLVYDTANRLKTSLDPYGNSEHFSYDAIGNNIRHRDRNNNTWQFNFDTAKRKTHKIAPEANISNVSKNGEKLAETSTRKSIVTNFVNDAHGNVTTVTQGLGLAEARSLETEFDGLNRLVGTHQYDVVVDDPNLTASISASPTMKITLSTQRVYNSQGKLIAEKDTSDHWKLYAYDSLGRCIFAVDTDGSVIEKTHDAFDKEKVIIKYANRLAINTADYSVTGISADIITKQLIKDPNNDRTATYEYDKRGNVISITENKKFFYSDGITGYEAPETRMSYDYQSSCTLTQMLIRPGVFANEFTWHDDKKNVVAEIKYHEDNVAYLTYYHRDTAGNILEKIEFAQAITWEANLNDTPQEMLKKIQKDPKDRRVKYEYNKLNKCTKEIYYSATYTTVEIKNGVPTPTTHVGTLFVKHNYDAMGNRIKTTYEDGSSAHFFYDERGYLCGFTKAAFTPYHGQAQIIPFVSYGIDPFGNAIRTTQHATALTALPPGKTTPSITANENDRTVLKLVSTSGKTLFKQDAECNLFAFTYTASGKIARQFFSYAENLTESTQILHIDETRYSYNPSNLPVSKQILRDNTITEQLFFSYNAFKQLQGESLDNINWPLYYRYDQSGYAYANNSTRNARAISVTNLANQTTLTFKSDLQDLSSISHTDIGNLILNPERKLIQRTESTVNFYGQLLATKAPFWVVKNVNGLPTQSFKRDRWDNILKQCDSNGYITQHTYGHRNELLTTTQPKVDVRNDKVICKDFLPVTVCGYTKRGVLTAETDALNNTDWFKLDEAGQLLQHIDAEGQIINTYNRNIFGGFDEDIDGRNVATLITRNRLGAAKEVKNPLYTQKFSYNIYGKMATRTDKFNHLYIFNYERNNLTVVITPLKLVTKNTYDHNHELILQIKPNNGVLKYQRDFFGNKLSFTDLSNVVTQFTYDFSANCTIEKASNLGHGDTMTFQEINNGDPNFPNVTQVLRRAVEIAKHIQREFEYGLLSVMTDYAKNRRTINAYDANGRLIAYEYRLAASNILLASVSSTFNALGWVTNNVSSVRTATGFYSTAVFVGDFDAVSNRRYGKIILTIAGYGLNCPAEIAIVDWVHSYTRARKIKILSGNFANDGSVIIGANKGTYFEYSGGFRISETLLYGIAANKIKITIGYNKASEYSDTIADNGMSTSRHIEAVADGTVLTTYNETFYLASKPRNTFNSQRISRVDANRREVVSVYKVGLIAKNLTTSRYYGNTDVPTNIISTSVDDKYVATYVTAWIYCRGFEDNMPYYSVGYKTRLGATTLADALMLSDPNGHVVGKINTADENDPAYGIYPPKTFLEMSGSVPISKYRVNEAPSPTTEATHFFSDVQNNLYAAYTAKTNASANAFGRHAQHHVNPNTGMEIRPEVTAKLFPTYPTTLGKILPSTDEGTWKLPQITPIINPRINDISYTVKQGDTLESIALENFGDKELARAISKNNGYLTQDLLSPGMTIFIPEHIANTNNADNVTNIQFFLNAIQGAILAYIPTPVLPQKNPHSALKTVIAVIATGLALLAATAFAPYLLSAAGTLHFISATTMQLGLAGFTGGTVTLATEIAAGVSAAIMDAAKQGLAIAIKVQDNFSGLEVLDAALTTGPSIGAMQGFKNAATTAAKSLAMLQMGQAAIQAQVVEMSFGLRKHFDPNAVIAQMSSMVVASTISKMPDTGAVSEVVRSVANNAANVAIGSMLYHTPIQAELIAAQSFNDQLDSELTEHLKSSAETSPDGTKDKYSKIRETERIQTHNETIQKPQPESKAPAYATPDGSSKSLGGPIQGGSTSKMQAKLHSENVPSKPKPQVPQPTIGSMAKADVASDWDYFKTHKRECAVNFVKDGIIGSIALAVAPGLVMEEVSKEAFTTAKNYFTADSATKRSMIARGLATGAENLPLLLTGAGAEIVVERVVISGAARVAARAVGRAAEVAGSRAAGVVGKVAEGVAGKLGRLGILKADNLVDFHLETGNVANIGAPNAANALRLKTTLRLQEAGILDHAGQLTATAIDRSVVVMSDGSVFNNQSVIDTLTKNGSHISDWQKLSTESVAMRTGQRIQVHFYRNKITGEVDYIHPDFKVKNPVKIFPKGRPQQEPTITPPYNRY